MSRTKGYGSYRGRVPKWKIALTVLLVLILLAAAVILILQRNIVYDESGTPHLEIPWQTEEPEEAPEDPVDMDLVIQEPAVPALPEIRAFRMPSGPLTPENCTQALAAADSACNAVVVTLKDAKGAVYFDSATAVSGSVKAGADSEAAFAVLEESPLRTVAAISCFRDPKAANSDVEGMGLKNTGGYIFYDGNNSQWLDPGKAAAREYLIDLAAEAAALGFDEILLTDVSYPTEGKLDKIDFSYAENAKSSVDEGRAYWLETFLQELRSALPENVTLSLEVPALVLAEGRDTSAGLGLETIAPLVDRICASAQPEETEAFSSAVSAASETTAFVPELAAPAAEGSYLLPQP